MSVKLSIDESILGYKKGKVVAEVNGNTIGECLNCMVKRRPSLKKVIFGECGKLGFGALDLLIKVNGEIIFFDADAGRKAVEDGDEIEVVAFAGGC